MQSLFGRDGDRLSVLRQPMGSSDFVAGEHYTYDDLPPGRTDYRMRRFSIDHDRRQILPLLRQALRLNPQLKVIGTPWSAPAWMKTNGSLIGGRLIDDPRIYEAYARYFVRFVREYRRPGVPVYAVTVQNEPQNRRPERLSGHGPAGRPGGQADRGDRACVPARRDRHEDPRLRPQLEHASRRHRDDAAGRGSRDGVPDRAAGERRRPVARRHRVPLLQRRSRAARPCCTARSRTRASGSRSARARTGRPTRPRRSSPTR